MKRTDKSYLALLMTFGERLHFETHRLEHALERFSSLERHVYYDYIGGEDRPSTQTYIASYKSRNVYATTRASSDIGRPHSTTKRNLFRNRDA
jgi:hypothetical protein